MNQLSNGYQISDGKIIGPDGVAIPPGEHVFVLRASDPLAITSLERYVQRGASSRPDLRKLAQAHQSLAAFYRWQAEEAEQAVPLPELLQESSDGTSSMHEVPAV